MAPKNKRKPKGKNAGQDGTGTTASRTKAKGIPTAVLRAVSTRDLAAPGNFINRELSLLEFNRRVLAQAQDARLPILERLRFLAICSSNLDEFFEIRAAGLKEKITHGLSWTGPDGGEPEEILEAVRIRARALVEAQYKELHEVLRPALAKEGVAYWEEQEWTKRLRAWTGRYFRNEVLPILTPISLDPAHPFPRVLNKGLSFLVQLEGSDAYGRSGGIAVIQAPRALPRVVRIPKSLSRARHGYVLLTSIIQAHVEALFPGMQVQGCYQFRVTRNSDLWVDEEEVENLLHALKGELPNRRYGEAVRLEILADCPDEMVDFLRQQMRLDEGDVFRVRGPVNLHRLSAVYEHTHRSDLKFPSFVPGIPRRLKRGKSIFNSLRRRGILLHHPYEQFSPVVELLRKAARDPNVLAIKMTLYRVGEESPVVEALHEAAQRGKEVTALVELRARFDEEQNIDLAMRLQEVGVNVVYGVVGFKAHTKLLMIVRKEAGRLRRYVHLGTGNYHSGTARAYTDFGWMTADRHVGEDVHRIFMQLTGMGKAGKLKKLQQSPFTLHRHLIKSIMAEAKAAKMGKPAWIKAKMNSLSEPEVMRALYRASQAGVKIDLVVRGICCLRPGVPGLSETIRVRSVVGRFLEHHRVYAFCNGEEPRVWLGSADWMSRNLKRRVEQAFPVEEEKAKARVLREGLDIYWDDNVQGWDLKPDGKYVQARPGKGEERRSAQEALLRMMAD